MAYRKKGNKYIVDCSYKGKRKTATVNTEEEAIHKDAEFTLFLVNASSAPDAGLATDDSWTLEYAYKRTLNDVWKGEKSEASATKNAIQVLDFFGRKTKLSQIDTEFMFQFSDYCIKTKGNSNATVNRKLAALSRMFTHALDCGKLNKLPKIPRKKEAQSAVTYLSDEQEAIFKNLFLQWDLNDHAEVFDFLIDTGLRIGECFSVKQKHVDFKAGALFLDPEVTKNGSSRTVPMTSVVREILQKRVAVFDKNTSLFPYNHSWMRVKWDKIREMQGHGDDGRFTPHILRRTCASRLVQRGVHLKVVQEWLGHKSIQVTMKYATLAPQQLFDAVKVLERAA